MPLPAGVFEFESDFISDVLSPFGLAAMGRVFEVVDDESFDGDSSLTATGVTINLCKALGDSFSVTIILTFDDLRRAVDILFAETIVKSTIEVTEK